MSLEDETAPETILPSIMAQMAPVHFQKELKPLK